MAALPLAAFLQLAAACSPNVAPETLAAIVKTESGFNANVVGVNGPDGRPHFYNSASESTVAAEGFIAAGRNVDLGIAQINWQAGHLQSRSLNVADAFVPCTALRVGGEVLVDCWNRSTGTDAQSKLRATFGCYNTGRPNAVAPYVSRVILSAQYVVPAIQVAGTDGPAPHEATGAPPQDPNAPPSWDVWGKEEYQEEKQPVQATPSPASAPAPAHSPPASPGSDATVAPGASPVVLHGSEIRQETLE
jgi:type IV secretion system protein VirB1